MFSKNWSLHQSQGGSDSPSFGASGLPESVNPQRQVSLPVWTLRPPRIVVTPITLAVYKNLLDTPLVPSKTAFGKRENGYAEA